MRCSARSYWQAVAPAVYHEMCDAPQVEWRWTGRLLHSAESAYLNGSMPQWKGDKGIVGDEGDENDGAEDAVHLIPLSPLITLSDGTRYTDLENPMSSSTTAPGPTGTLPGLGWLRFRKTILSRQTLRRKSENTSMVSCSPGQRR
jgi:hypothetical protein